MAAVPAPPTVLIYAGGSVFGRLLAAELLARTPARLLLVGPDGEAEARAARALDPQGTRVRPGQARLADAERLGALVADVDVAVACMRGFRGAPATLIDACVAHGTAYFDIADSRDYVHRVLGRRTAIEAAGITAGPGLGILPGLSALLTRYVVDELALYEIARVDVGVFIGSHRARGVGALAAALRCAGRPLARNVYGWSGRQRTSFPAPLGPRPLYNFDGPDYDLLPALFGIRQDRVRVRMGFELDIVNRVLAMLGLLRRVGWRWRYRSPLITLLVLLSAPLRLAGEDRGAVSVTVRGITSLPRHHAAIRAGTAAIMAPDARLLWVLPCALAVERALSGQLGPGLLDWRTWIAPAAMWDALHGHGLSFEWSPE